MAMGTPDPVAALAAQVRDLRGIVVEVKARMDRAGMSGSAKLHEQVAALARTVAALAEEGPAPRITAPNWTAMDEAERAEQLAALAAWTDGFLRLNYPHALTRPCWASHAAAVWELSTLRAEWQRVYDRKHPDLAAALTWHDRWLPGVASRLEKILGDCRGRCALARAQTPARLRPRAG